MTEKMTPSTASGPPPSKREAKKAPSLRELATQLTEGVTPSGTAIFIYRQYI